MQVILSKEAKRRERMWINYWISDQEHWEKQTDENPERELIKGKKIDSQRSQRKRGWAKAHFKQCIYGRQQCPQINCRQKSIWWIRKQQSTEINLKLSQPKYWP